MPQKLIFLVILILPLSCGFKPGSQLLAGETTNDKALFPLAAGRRWTYQVRTLGGWQACKSGTITQSVVGTSVVESRTAYELSPLCDSTYTSFWSVVGDRTDLRYLDRWVPALDTPLEADHTWQTGDANFIWYSNAAVPVKGTTYTNCWTRRQTDTPNTFYETYCLGVGKVISHFADVSGAGWDAQLVSRNF